MGSKQHRALRTDIFRLAAGTVSIRIARDRIEVTGHHLLAKAAQHEDRVVLENNNEYLTQLSAEGPPLFRSLLEALRE